MGKRLLSQELILCLRQLARNQATVRELVEEVRKHLGASDGLSLVVDRYLIEAFLLSLDEARHVEGSSCLGSKLYDDSQIDELLLPFIAASRQKWGEVEY